MFFMLTGEKHEFPSDPMLSQQLYTSQNRAKDAAVVMATTFYGGSDSVCHIDGKVSRECGRGDTRGVTIVGTRRWIFQGPKGL